MLIPVSFGSAAALAVTAMTTCFVVTCPDAAVLRRNFLQAYEECHPEDLTSDRCAYCGGGEEMGQDWVACVKCNNWVHFQCDKRGSLGSFKDYAKDAGIEYVCLRCAGE